jgi:predicted acyl esterase
LPSPYNLVGNATLDLWMTADVEDTDLVAKIAIAEPVTGRVVCITSGCLRCRYREDASRPLPLTPGEPTRMCVRFPTTAYQFPPGSRIVLMITSSCYPRIEPHPNVVVPPLCGIEGKQAQISILHYRAHPTRLMLPRLRE